MSIYCDGQRFVDYSDPMLYCHLLSTDSLHRHYHQYERDLVSMRSGIVDRKVEVHYDQTQRDLVSMQSGIADRKVEVHYDQTQRDLVSMQSGIVDRKVEDKYNEVVAQQSVSQEIMKPNQSHVLMFPQSTANDYDYSDSEREEITQIEQSNRMPIEMELSVAKYDRDEKYKDILDRQITFDRELNALEERANTLYQNLIILQEHFDSELHRPLLSTNTLHQHHDQTQSDIISIQADIDQYTSEADKEEKYDEVTAQQKTIASITKRKITEYTVSVINSEQTRNTEHRLIFQRFTASDYNYSDSEQDHIVPIDTKNMSIEMQLSRAKHNEFIADLDGRIPNLQLFEDPIGNDLRNRLCPYCLMIIWTERHRQECLFIPQCLK